MSTKICKRCRQEQSVDNFRHYYGGRKGRYSYCKDCERIEARRKYLMRRGDACTQDQRVELAKIAQLYELRKANHLAVPGTRAKSTVLDLVQRQLDALGNEPGSDNVPG